MCFCLVICIFVNIYLILLDFKYLIKIIVGLFKLDKILFSNELIKLLGFFLLVLFFFVLLLSIVILKDRIKIRVIKLNKGEY